MMVTRVVDHHLIKNMTERPSGRIPADRRFAARPIIAGLDANEKDPLI